jgi:hypothetical protein
LTQRGFRSGAKSRSADTPSEPHPNGRSVAPVCANPHSRALCAATVGAHMMVSVCGSKVTARGRDKGPLSRPLAITFATPLKSWVLARSRPEHGQHGRFRGQQAGGPAGVRSHHGLYKKRPHLDWWTRRLCNTFFNVHRAPGDQSGTPPVIMSLIVRFTTRGPRRDPPSSRRRPARTAMARAGSSWLGSMPCLASSSRRGERLARDRPGRRYLAAVPGAA